MKTKIFSLLTGAALMAGFSACSDNWNGQDPDGKGIGRLDASTLGVEVDGAETVVTENSGAKKSVARIASRTDAVTPTITLDNFIVTVTTPSGTEVNHWSYKELVDMDFLPTFTAGDYILNVKSHNVEPAAWNAPYYEGSQSFTIEANKVTEVKTVVCTLANIRVSVNFSAQLLKAFDNPDEVTVKVTSEGNNSLTFTPALSADGNSGYFAALADLETLRIDFAASINGNVEKFTKTIDNVSKGQHRKINFGLTDNPANPPEEVGTITNDGDGITVNTEVVDDEPIISDYDWFEDNLDDKDRPGGEQFDDPDKPDDPQNPDDPKEDAISFESSSLNLEGMNYAADFPSDGSKPAAVDIKAKEGIANLLVEIISDDLTASMLQGVGLDATFDLAYPGDLEATLSNPDGFNFPTGDKVIGQTSVTFNIAPFVPLLNIYPGKVHSFRITVTDQKGNVKSLLLEFQA